MRAAMRAARTAAWTLCVVAAASAPLGAQRARTDRATGGALAQVEELTRLGRTEEARGALSEWWAAAGGDATRDDMQRALWLRGRLTVDPVQAELDFQRLVVLYPSGPYTPGALFRLAQAAHAEGEGATAEGYVAAIARDYPNAPARREAEAWLRQAGPADEPPRQASVAPPARTTRRSPRETAPGAGPPAPARREASPDQYFVQLGAFADSERAIALFEQVRDAGLDARIVRVDGSRFLHVRVGRFASSPDATEQLEALLELGFSAAVVRDERGEQVVRGPPRS